MPRPRPPHLHREQTRHGAWVWYVRVGKGPRIRIRAEYGTPAFHEAYRKALDGEAISPATAKFAAHTLGWLIARYRESSTWADLSAATRRQRENIFRHVIESAGAEPLSRLTRKEIVAGRDRRRDTPHAARHFVQTMRGLFQWALEAEHVSEDPTRGVKAPRPATDGFHVWTLDECTTYESRWPVGTRERLAFDLLLYTGLRRGDAVRVGRPHVKNGIATIRTEKTGEIVYILILAPLRASIDAGPVGELTYIAGEHGKPLTKESFGNWFREICRQTGVPGSAHGLRKAGATRAAENGATVAQLEALFGWRGHGMASLYTDQADRLRLATEAAPMLLTEQDRNAHARTLATGAGPATKKPNYSDR